MWRFHTNIRFERKVKGASALYCVYIKKKNKVLYVFITLIIVIKSLPFLICGLGNFVCFSCLGVSFVFFFCFFFFPGFVFFWLKEKKKKQPAFSVCAAAGQDIKMLKF